MTMNEVMIDKTGKIDPGQNGIQYAPHADGVMVYNENHTRGARFDLYASDPINLWEWADTVLRHDTAEFLPLVDALRAIFTQIEDIAVISAGMGNEGNPDCSYWLEGYGFEVSITIAGPNFLLTDMECGDTWLCATPNGVVERIKWLQTYSKHVDITRANKARTDALWGNLEEQKINTGEG